MKKGQTIGITKAIKTLNEMFDADLQAITKLLEVRTYCNRDLSNFSGVTTINETIGVLGLLNGLFSLEDSNYKIAVRCENGIPIRFELLDLSEGKPLIKPN